MSQIDSEAQSGGAPGKLVGEQEHQSGKPPLRFRTLFFVVVLAIDIALLLTLLEGEADQPWIRMLSKVGPYVFGTLLLAKLEQVREYLVSQAEKLHFDVVVSVACALLLYVYYWLPNGTVSVPIRLDALASPPTVIVNDQLAAVRGPRTSSSSGIVKIPLRGTGKTELAVTTVVADSGGFGQVEASDVYTIGVFERLRAWKVLRRSPLDYVLELPSTFPVTLQFERERDREFKMLISGRFPLRFLEEIDDGADPLVERLGPRRGAGDDGYFSSDSARLTFLVQSEMASRAVNLPLGAYMVHVEEHGCIRAIPVTVSARVLRIEVDTYSCGGGE